MSHFLKYTLAKDDKAPSKPSGPKQFKTVNMYNMTASKSESKWNLDEVLDVMNGSLRKAVRLRKGYPILTGHCFGYSSPSTSRKRYSPTYGFMLLRTYSSLWWS